MLLSLRTEQRRPVSLISLFPGNCSYSSSRESSGSGRERRRERCLRALWENKGSVSSPLGLGAALKCCRMAGVGWGGVEEHRDDGEVGGRRQRLRLEGCLGWSRTLT